MVFVGCKVVCLNDGVVIIVVFLIISNEISTPTTLINDWFTNVFNRFNGFVPII